MSAVHAPSYSLTRWRIFIHKMTRDRRPIKIHCHATTAQDEFIYIIWMKKKTEQGRWRGLGRGIYGLLKLQKTYRYSGTKTDMRYLRG